ncbi:MAG: hypothetical protein M1170_00730 [Patescibacteria group bacterium]|nr:hypothetical protein [Patescibacteria group bacterium]
MILSSHIIVASATSAPFLAKTLNFQNAVFILFASLASHFLIDMIPHWDYQMSSFPKENGERLFVRKTSFFIKDLTKNFLDFFAGIAVAVFIVGWPQNFMGFLAFGLVIFGAILPDALAAIFIISKWRFLEPLYKFHVAIHGKRIINPFWGFISQIFILVFIVLIFRVILS